MKFKLFSQLFEYQLLIPSIERNVIVNKTRNRINSMTKMKAVFGRFSKFKNGPSIVNKRPTTLEIKNLGNLNTFSQKSGIFNIYLYFIF